nr:putative xanthine dehydrogenase molybdenum-binding subunit XdhA [uncultured bacterium]
MRLFVNERSVEVESHQDETAIDLLRDRLNLTGAKLCCGSGTCGACTILVDGTPVCACLLPATALEGRHLRTIEALPDASHPVQRAFMYEDAMQCGFCTPGFVMHAVAFHDEWRRRFGDTMPSADAVSHAFSGHLCRCGTYPAVSGAIARACAGQYDTAPAGMPPRYDARAKVTGTATYTVDVRLPDMLEGRLVRAPLAHAIVDDIDMADALNVEGAKAVVVFAQAGAEIRYVGQEVAAVAAIDLPTADRAVAAARVTFQPKPAVVSAASAVLPGAARVYSALEFGKASESELPIVPARWHGNVRGPTSLLSEHGHHADEIIDGARDDRDGGLVDGRWHASSQSHTALEPHAAVAHWRADGTLDVYLSTQACSDMAIAIADRFGLETSAVRVLCPFTGGAFGAKAELTMEAVAAIELSRQVGVPVRIALTREEEFAYGGYRPAVDLDVALEVDELGTMKALALTAHTDGGTAIGSTVAAVGRFTYPAVPKHLRDYDVVSHTPPAKPFRGPGGAAAFWGMEQAIDRAAEQRGFDPIDLRATNDPNPVRMALLNWARSLPVWRERQARQASHQRVVRGVGMATGAWVYFTQPSTEVTVGTLDGELVVSTAGQDVGTGTRTVLATIVANIFDVEPHAIRVDIGDSTLARGPMSSGSRTAASIGPAAAEAARQVRDELLQFATKHFSGARVEPCAGGVRRDGAFVPWSAISSAAPRVSVTSKRPRDPGGSALPFALDGFLVGRGTPMSVHVSEVEVDRWLGHVRVCRIWTGLAVGRLIAPQLARSQALGAAVQGVGYALYEERRLDPVSGRTLTVGFDEHRHCGIADAPDIDVHFVTEGFEHVAGGSVGLGELSGLAVAASIGNAVYHATGWRPTALPLRPERLIEALAVESR